MEHHTTTDAPPPPKTHHIQLTEEEADLVARILWATPYDVVKHLGVEAPEDLTDSVLRDLPTALRPSLERGSAPAAAAELGDPDPEYERQFPDAKARLLGQFAEEVEDGTPHDLFAVVGEDGWRPPQDFPNDDRTVQLALDDMSFGPTTLGFCDGVSGSTERVWWNLKPTMHPLNLDQVGAWRDLPARDNADDCPGCAGASCLNCNPPN